METMQSLAPRTAARSQPDPPGADGAPDEWVSWTSASVDAEFHPIQLAEEAREVRDRHREALEEMRRSLRDMKDAQKPGRN